MSITIIKAGLLDTIQDMGRYGFAKWGINTGGAMDPFAAGVSNMLSGNCTTEAVMEIHFPGPQLLFGQNTLLAITGADFTPTLNDEPIPLWQPVVVRKNTLLHFPKLVQGARCYLSVHGGFCLEKWLGSYSTHLKAGAGGFNGRALKKGDELFFRDNRIYVSGRLRETDNLRVMPWKADISSLNPYGNNLSVIPGKEWDALSPGAKILFTEKNFVVHPSSDRMGYQLEGPALEQYGPADLISAGVDFGTIQLLPDGQLIVLMADHQTTGGYPKIAHVISTHLPGIAQMRPGSTLRFTLSSVEQAETLLLRRAPIPAGVAKSLQ